MLTHIASFDSLNEVLAYCFHDTKINYLFLGKSRVRKCHHSTCKLFWLYKIFWEFKPVECIECQKNKHEVELFGIALDVVFISMQFFLRLSDLPRFILHCILFLWKHNSFMWIYLFKRKKTLRKGCVYSHSDTCLFRFPYTYMQITLNLAVFARDKNIAFDLSDACLFGHPVYFDYRDFLGFASDLSFQSFNAGKLSEMR